MRIGSCVMALALAASLSAFVRSASAADADFPTRRQEEIPTKVKPPPKVDPSFFFINDNRFTFAYMPDGRQAGVIGPVQREVVAFTHFDAWAYGTNYLNALYAKSAKNDSASPCPIFGAPANCAGETFMRATVRSTFGFNEIFNTNAFSWGGILRNVSLEVGGDADTTNAFIAATQVDAVAGLQFAFNLPYKGFLNVVPLYFHDSGHNSFLTPAFMPPGYTGLPDGNMHYHGTWAIEANYYMDLGFLPENLQYFAISGRAGLYGPRGSGAYGNYTIPAYNKTVPELISEPIRLTFDASKLLWGSKYSHYIDLWVSYLYRLNRYGYDATNPANPVCYTAGVSNQSCNEKTLYTGVTVKW